MYQEILQLPDHIMGKNLHTKVIPTVCNLRNMLEKLKLVAGDYSQLKQWEKQSYKAYNIESIKTEILYADKSQWPNIICKHILTGDKTNFGASCVDIYLVAYVSKKYGVGKETFFKYIYDHEITDKHNSANAIWQVGKGDGVYLGILHDNGTIKDIEFIKKWIDR